MDEGAPRRGTTILVVLTLLGLMAAGAVLWQYRTTPAPKQPSGVQLAASDDESSSSAPSGAPSGEPSGAPSTGLPGPGGTVESPQAAEARCGAAVPKPGGGTWTCTFADDFDGHALDPERWAAQASLSSGSGGARACTVDSPRTVAVRGGVLRLTVRPGERPTRCQQRWASYEAGSVSTAGLFSQRYGRFEARIKAPATAGRGQPGLHEAFWLWPAAPGAGDDWPASGEIDVAETYSDQPGVAVPYLHYGARDNGGPVEGTTTASDCRAARGQWHDYVLVWTPASIRISVDGRTCLVNDGVGAGFAAAFGQQFAVNLTAQLGSEANAWAGGRPMPATTLVDHVRVWR